MKIETFSDLLYLSLFRFFQFIIRVVPDRPKRSVLRALAVLIYRFDFSHRHIAGVNLDLAYGDSLDEAEKERIIRKTYENLVFNLADFVENQTITREQILSKVSFENSHIFENALGTKKPIIFITAHYGNWELLPMAVTTRFNTSVDVVGRPLPSKVMDDILRKNREQFNVTLINKTGAMRPMLNALKNNRILGLLIDQNVGKGPIIEFFGKKATHIPTAAQLAFKFDASVIPVFIISNDDRTHYTIRFFPPITIEPTGDLEQDILLHVQAQASVIEAVIREKPDEWFWLHKRWKSLHKARYQRS